MPQKPKKIMRNTVNSYFQNLFIQIKQQKDVLINRATRAGRRVQLSVGHAIHKTSSTRVDGDLVEVTGDAKGAAWIWKWGSADRMETSLLLALPGMLFSQL